MHRESPIFFQILLKVFLVSHDKILSIERAATKSWSEYTTDELKSEKLIKYNAT